MAALNPLYGSVALTRVQQTLSLQKKVHELSDRELSTLHMNTDQLILIFNTNPKETRQLFRTRDFNSLKARLQEIPAEQTERFRGVFSWFNVLQTSGEVLEKLNYLSRFVDKSPADLIEHQIEMMKRLLNNINVKCINIYIRNLSNIEEVINNFNDKETIRGNEIKIVNAIKNTTFYENFQNMYVSLHDVANATQDQKQLRALAQYDKTLQAFCRFSASVNESAHQELLPTAYVVAPPKAAWYFADED